MSASSTLEPLNKDDNWLLSLSIKFFHSTMGAEEIINSIGLTPSVNKTFDKDYLKKTGRLGKLKNGINILTEAVFDILKTAAEIANDILLGKKDFLKKF